MLIGYSTKISIQQPDTLNGKNMQIDTGYAIVTILDEHVILVETKEGMVMDKNVTKNFYETIEREMPGQYSLVINRKHAYKLMRFEVYGEANSHTRLNGIAIVTHKTTAGIMAKIEEPLSKKPFETFTDVDQAIAWAKSLHVEK
jgi:hypothetical protein